MAASSLSFASSSSSSASRAADPPSYLSPGLRFLPEPFPAWPVSQVPDAAFLMPDDVAGNASAHDQYLQSLLERSGSAGPATMPCVGPWWASLPPFQPPCGAELARAYQDEFAAFRGHGTLPLLPPPPPPPPPPQPLPPCPSAAFITPPVMAGMGDSMAMEMQDTPTELLEAAAVALLSSSTARRASPQPANAAGPVLASSLQQSYPAPAPQAAAAAANNFYALLDVSAPAVSSPQQPANRSRSSSDGSLSVLSFRTHDSARSGCSAGDLHVCRWHACRDVFNTAKALTEHVNDDHVPRRLEAYRCRWAECRRAEHVFRQRDKIMVHMRLHTNDRRFRCTMPGCGREFSRADSYEEHRRVHSAAGKEAVCHVAGCGRQYFHAKSLRKHQRMAHGMSFPSDTRLGPGGG